jgi:hypothetical protein
MPQRSAAVSIPTPCSESWAAMTPTSAGRHCAICRTEVVDFTKMSEAEVIAYLAAHSGQQLCGRLAAPAIVPRPVKRVRGPLRWLLAITTLVGWQTTALGLPPQVPPSGGSLLKAAPLQAAITIRGVVLDDAFNVPVEGAYIFIKGTQYGAIADANGRFTLSLPANWEPIKGGILTLLVLDDPFSFLDKVVRVDLKNPAHSAPLSIRLQSQPERGIVMGKPVLPQPPAVLPSTKKSRQ